MKWPTPDANAVNLGEKPDTFLARREKLKEKGYNGNGAGIPLTIAVQMHWPTPTMGDSKSSGSRNTATSKANHGVSPTDAIRGDGGTGRSEPSGLSLHPDWVELLMGWPRGWTRSGSMDAAEMKAWLRGFQRGDLRFGDVPEYGIGAWADGSWERGQARVGTQIPDRVARLRALGNGQVPACVVLAWSILLERIGGA